jgi:hypothetical protein
MPGQHQVDCEVEIDPEKELGTYTNAFRVRDLEHGRCVLEFLVYSETGNKARVVLKIPVRKAFLPVIRDNIDTCLGRVKDAG